MKNVYRIISLIYCTLHIVCASEGMWLPHLIQALKEKDLQAAGWQLTADDIYSLQANSLNDQMVHFNGGCSGSLISATGLIITNYHCAENFVQSHSTLEKNYIKNGFWAKSTAEELANKNLEVTFIRAIETVTDAVLEHTQSLEGQAKKEQIAKNIAQIINNKEKSLQNTDNYHVKVLPFDYETAYFLFVTQTFKDVRLVGVPPFTLGQFGLDADNWEWPRHAADFALFRIYADKNNRPAAYQKENQPYQNEHFLTISNQGVKENDFTMVYGFPGRTAQHLTAAQIDALDQILLPIGIKMRQKTLEILADYMQDSEEINLQYIPKQRSVANSWKKWKGIKLGFKNENLSRQKLQEEQIVLEKIAQEDKEAAKKAYAALKDLRSIYLPTALWQAQEYFTQWNNAGSDFFGLIDDVMQRKPKALANWAAEKEKIEKDAALFYKNFNFELDKTLFTALTQILYEEVQLPTFAKEISAAYSVEQLTKAFYSTNWSKENQFKNVLQRSKNAKDFYAQLEKQPFIPLYHTMKKVMNQVDQEIQALKDKEKEALKEWVFYKKKYSDKQWAYDANSTLRVAYGKVERVKKDGMEQNFYTTFEGLIAKYIPGHQEYDLPSRMVELYDQNNFGRYAYPEGSLRLCFVASNPTTGGNSGSAVLDAKGRLIGLNFDRTYQSTVSDYWYNAATMRNIAVDMRYILFVMDYFAEAKNLLAELRIE